MIQPIVEGHGEVEAVPVLLRHVMNDGLGVYATGVRRPIRRPRDQLLSRDGLSRAIAMARCEPDVSAILVICDLDDDCARDILPDLLMWGQSEARPFPFGIALARREYEAWLLASLPSLAGRGRIQADAAF